MSLLIKINNTLFLFKNQSIDFLKNRGLDSPQDILIQYIRRKDQKSVFQQAPWNILRHPKLVNHRSSLTSLFNKWAK